MQLQSEEELSALLELDTSEFMGRRLFINKDHDNYQLKRFVEKIGGMSFKLDDLGDPELGLGLL